jgi:hypothetical protein
MPSAELHNPTFLGTLAEGLAKTGHSDAALIAIDDAIAPSDPMDKY